MAKPPTMTTTAGAMQGVPANIIKRQLAHFEQIDPAYAKGVIEALACS